MFCFWNLWSNIVMSTELLSSQVQAMSNICQCRACFSYCILFFFYRCRISQILQCAFMWRGHWKSCYSVQFSKLFYWKHWSNAVCICIYFIIFYRILQYPPYRAFIFASNSIERSSMYVFDDNRKLGNKLSKYETWENT